jgi:hypothetical protein
VALNTNNHRPVWLNAWLLFKAKGVFFHLYHGENKLHFDEMMSPLNWINTHSWTFIVLTHWNNSALVNMSLHLETLIVAVGFNVGGNQRKPTCRKSLTTLIHKCCVEYSSPSARFELTTLVVIGSDCTGSCKSNYHAVTTTTAPTLQYNWKFSL